MESNHIQENKEIRVFVSSTFADLHEERDYIIRRTFQRLEGYCRKRGISFTGVDLRWGITESASKDGKTIRICLDEIHRCEPFFINIIGERYGWIPTREDLSRDIELENKYKNVIDVAINESLSITEMEIREGVFKKEEQINAFFFLCDRDIYKQKNIEKNIPIESEEISNKLTALRDKILDSGYPVFDGFESKEQLGNLIYDSIKNSIDEKYPLDADLTEFEKIKVIQKAYAHSRCDVYIKSSPLNGQLNTWVKDNTNRLMIVSESGMGKSAFVANLLDNENNRKEFGIEGSSYIYYVGASSDELIDLLKYFLNCFEQFDEIPEHLKHNLQYLKQKLIDHLNNLNVETYIIIDAVNQLELAGDSLSWLDVISNDNIKFILTSTPEITMSNTSPWSVIMIESMNEADIRNIIKEVLYTKGKVLESELMDLLMENVYYDRLTSFIKQNYLETTYGLYAGRLGNPMYLRTFMDELIQGSTFDTLKETILKYRETNNVKELLELRFTRLEEEFGKTIIGFVLGHIYLSRDGLSEQELRILAIDQDIPYLNILECLNNITIHLISNGKRLNFYHSYIRKTVEERYLSNTEVVTNFRKNIIKVFMDLESVEIRTQEIPYQFNKLDQYEEMTTFFHNKALFTRMCAYHPKEFHQYLRNAMEVNVSILDGIYEIFREDSEVMETLCNFSKAIREDYITINISNRLLDLSDITLNKKLQIQEDLIDLYSRQKKFDMALKHGKAALSLLDEYPTATPEKKPYFYLKLAFIMESNNQNEMATTYMGHAIKAIPLIEHQTWQIELNLLIEKLKLKLQKKSHNIPMDNYIINLQQLLDQSNGNLPALQKVREELLLELARAYKSMGKNQSELPLKSKEYYNLYRASYEKRLGNVHLNAADLLLEIGETKSGWLMKVAILGGKHPETLDAFKQFKDNYKKFIPDIEDSINTDEIYSEFITYIDENQEFPDYETLEKTIKPNPLMKIQRLIKINLWLSNFTLVAVLMLSGLFALGFVLRHSNWLIIPMFTLVGVYQGNLYRSKSFVPISLSIFLPNILLAIDIIPKFISNSVAMIWMYRYNLDALISALAINKTANIELNDFLLQDVNLFRLSLIRWLVFTVAMVLTNFICQFDRKEQQLVDDLMIAKRGEVLDANEDNC